MKEQNRKITFTCGGVTAAKGFKAAGIYCGIGNNSEKGDLALIFCDKPASCAAVYTRNKVKAAHIAVMKRFLADGKAQAVIINSGNANTCTPDGEDVAERICGLTAGCLGIRKDYVLPASTGVIGVPLPEEPFRKALPELCGRLSTHGSGEAARAIMTTDTVQKEFAVTFKAGGKTCTIGGIAKGSGMIHINMGTMLCFMTTDAAISSHMLEEALRNEIQSSFNQVSVDGDTSTNDTLLIMADGLAGNEEITGPGEDFDSFCEALHVLSVAFSKKIASDGEGATRLIEAHVTGAPDVGTARIIAKSIISSSLLKAAIYGEDANWGRILCAAGYADAEFSCDNVGVIMESAAGSVEVCRSSASVPFDEGLAKKILGEDEIRIEISLNDGDSSAYAWGCDLTHDYVTINGAYRS